MSDYISREAAVECAKHAYAKGLEPTQYIEEIPAADVAPVRHGRWNGPLKIIAGSLRAISVPCVGSSITGQESAAFVTAPAAAQKWKVVQTDDAVQR